MKKSQLILIAVILLLIIITILKINDDKFDSKSLISDARQLADMIENIYPDPYKKFGGKEAFYRRVQSIIDAIPEQGMSHPDFYRLLRPFVTALADAHTWLRDPYEGSPGGIPLYFGVVGTDLYVLAVPEEQYRPLIGALLISVEGVPHRELLIRLRTMVSAENDYQLLRNLAYAGILMDRSFLSDLLPEWREKNQVRIVLRDKDGHEAEHTFPVPSQVPERFISPGSRIERPRPGPAGFTYTFLDSERTTALLVVDDMGSYREAFEMWSTSNPAEAEQPARELYQQLHQTSSPEDMNSVIAGLPSATDTLRALVEEMRKESTTTLLIDLRYNGGGNSAMYNIPLYFLRGTDELLRPKLHRTEIKRYSKYSPEKLKKIQSGKCGDTHSSGLRF